MQKKYDDIIYKDKDVEVFVRHTNKEMFVVNITNGVLIVVDKNGKWASLVLNKDSHLDEEIENIIVILKSLYNTKARQQSGWKQLELDLELP